LQIVSAAAWRRRTLHPIITVDRVSTNDRRIAQDPSHLQRIFRRVQVLKNIDLEILRGEVLGIIGENGAGKSTLMKILGGIYTPTSGQITSRDAPCNPRTRRRQET
jgi:ABC-type sugar transport system ATPase subunit